MAAPFHPVVAAGIAAAGGFGPALGQLANECAANAAATAANTAAISALDDKVVALDTKVVALDAKVVALDIKIGALDAKIGALDANVAALSANVGALAATVAPLAAAIAAAIAALNIPAIAAGAAAHAHAVTLARAENAHDRRGVPLAAVPLAGGPGVLMWPPGFDREDLFEGAIIVVDMLLQGYGLPSGAAAGSLFARRNALALHLGTQRC